MKKFKSNPSFKKNFFRCYSIENHLSNLKEASTFGINSLTNKLISEGKDIIKFGLG